ncbi:MAG: hypothetical protein MJH11_14395 [Lentisphaeria bacterium]|nr:hypothetical protein [Lentisphaeria bacterium]
MADVKKEVEQEKNVARNLIILSTKRFAKDMEDPKAIILMKMAMILDNDNEEVILTNHSFQNGKKIKALKGGMTEAKFFKNFEKRTEYLYNKSKKNKRLQTLAFLYAKVLEQFIPGSKAAIITIVKLKDDMDVEFADLLDAEMSIEDMFVDKKTTRRKTSKNVTKKETKKIDLHGLDLNLNKLRQRYRLVKKSSLCKRKLRSCNKHIYVYKANGTIIYWFSGKARGVGQNSSSLKDFLDITSDSPWIKKGDQYVTKDKKWIAFQYKYKYFIWERLWYDSWWKKNMM